MHHFRARHWGESLMHTRLRSPCEPQGEALRESEEGGYSFAARIKRRPRSNRTVSNSSWPGQTESLGTVVRCNSILTASEPVIPKSLNRPRRTLRPPTRRRYPNKLMYSLSGAVQPV